MIELQPDLELSQDGANRLVRAWLGDTATCTGITALRGGLVNSVFRLDVDRAPFRAVVKLHGPTGATFEREAAALRHLRAETNCPVPEVHLHDAAGRLAGHAALLLEHVDGECLDGLGLASDERDEVERELAAVLADLHGHTAAGFGGIDPVDRVPSWADRFAARLAEVRAYPSLDERLTAEQLASVDAAIGLVEPLLGDAGAPTLVHGDVWDGNLLVRHEGGRWRLAALLDPDLQYADVELELAYLEVFDNPRTTLFSAYTAQRRLRPGYEERRRCYWLYTGLLHVALFDDGFFRDFTVRTAEELVRR